MVYLILDDFWLVEMYEFPYNELLWFITTKNQSGCRNNIVSVQRIVMVYLKRAANLNLIQEVSVQRIVMVYQ